MSSDGQALFYEMRERVGPGAHSSFAMMVRSLSILRKLRPNGRPINPPSPYNGTVDSIYSSEERRCYIHMTHHDCDWEWARTPSVDMPLCPIWTIWVTRLRSLPMVPEIGHLTSLGSHSGTKRYHLEIQIQPRVKTVSSMTP